MWLLAALAGGLALRAYAVLLLPMAYALSRKNRDWGLAVYFVYGVLVLNAASFSDFLSYQALKIVLMLVLPSLMALREMMMGFEIPRKAEPGVLIPAALFILGAVYDVLFFAGIVLTLLSGFKSQHFVTAKNLLAPIGFLTVVIAIIRAAYPSLYTPETQVALAAAVAIFAILLGLREREQVEFRVV